MSHDDHEHEHEHDACCGHDHGHEDAHDEGVGAAMPDPASQSLSDALRVSFRLLSFIMILMLGGFLASGMTCIQPQQQGIVKVFGKVTGTVGQGLAYTWPYPIGEIEVISAKETRVAINDFWLNEPEGEAAKDLDQRRPAGAGLKPGYDGALLTGDRNLVHVKLVCTYVIRDPRAYKRNVSDANELVRSAVCAAAVSTAADRTADSIMLAGIADFTSQIKQRAQEQIDGVLGSARAVELASVGIPSQKETLGEKGTPAITWPLSARPAYNAAQRASQEAQEIRVKAIADATNTLQIAAGNSYVKLVGEAWMPERNAQHATDANEYNLIGQYDLAVRSGQTAQAGAMLRKIDEILMSESMGEASQILVQAQANRTAIEESVKRRVEQFRTALPDYAKYGDFVLQRRLADVLDKVLGYPLVEKFYIPPGKEKMVLRVGREPENTRLIQREEMKKAKEDEAKASESK